MRTPQDHYIDVGGVNTRYWVEGHGSPIILLHGLGGFAETWLPCFWDLTTSYCVYAFDWIGQGRTDKPLDRSYQILDMVYFFRDLMTALEIEQAHLVGHSIGGAIAARFAFMFPQQLDKLVLVSSAGLGKELRLGLRLGTVPVLGEILTRPSRSKIAQAVRGLSKDSSEGTDESVDLWYEIASLPETQRTYLKTLRANANLWGQLPSRYGPLVAGLGSITNPVMVIWGRQDTVVPMTHAQVAARKLPNVRMEIIEGCGHIPMLEQPDIFTELVLEFLGNGTQAI